MPAACNPAHTILPQERACSICSDATVGIFIVINRVDGVWALLARGSGIGASDVCGGRSCGEVGTRGLRLLVGEVSGGRV